MPWFAIVFNRDCGKGQDPDPQQHWKEGDLYSVGTVVNKTTLPSHFDVVEVDGPQNGRTWNPTTRSFISTSSDAI